MILFPKDFPDKLRSAILTSEIVAKKVALKQRGKDFIGLCPFHNEKTPSFTVNDQKGFYHCFGCQEHGDIISFVMKTQSLEFQDAIKHLADSFGIEIPKVTFNQQCQEKTDRNYLLTAKICEIFEENLSLPIAESARKYIAKRGLKKEIIKKFHLGFAPNSYDFLHKNLQAKGFSDNELQKSGVIAQNNNKKLYDKFRNRLVFPIFDKKDRVIAFGGRVLGDDLPKYLNSAETEIFKKNQTLYNINNARKAIFEQKYAVIVEGYMDVISLDANGIENVVAGLGTALSANHITELFAITDKIVICLDGDSAGIRAAKRTAEIALPLISAKKNISFTFLPNNLDPDDFVRSYGKNVLIKSLTEHSVGLSQALFEFTLIDLDLVNKDEISPENKAKIEANLFKKLDLIKDVISRKYFKQFFSDILFNFGRKTFKKGEKSSKNDKKLPNSSNLVKNIFVKQTGNMADNLAKNIIAFIIKYPKIANYADESFDLSNITFLNPVLTDIKDQTLSIIEENPEISENNLLLALENYGHNDYIIDIGKIFRTIFEHGFVMSESEINEKMRLLLLKESFYQVEEQYKQALQQETIDTHHSEIIGQKIKEIFAYKTTLEHKILALVEKGV